MTMNGHMLKQFATERFKNQLPVLSLWQELSEHFYPERANFLRVHNVGEELSDNLSTSQPILIRRELANSFEGMLRDGKWFKIGIEGEPDEEGQRWLDWASNRLLLYFNQRTANFRRATKEVDNDYATFGNGVMSIEMNRRYNGLLFRSWHMRDTAWWDDEQGQVGGLVRKQEMTLYDMAQYFGESNLHKAHRRMLPKKPFKPIKLYHFDMPSQMYGDGEFEQFARVSLWMDIEHELVLEKFGMQVPIYIVPRFQTIAGSAYAYSPATVVGLPDARTLQAMTHTLLEAGERLARPPIIATENVIRGDANLYPDGITYVAEDYDQRSGAAMEVLKMDAKGFPLGAEMRESIIEVLQSAFYINKIGMPETTHEMTAYEVQERMKQYRRENLPLFAPIEHDYSGRMCELGFFLMRDNNFLGPAEQLPESLKEAEVRFIFESPLSSAEGERKATQFSQVAALLAEAAQFDPGVSAEINFSEAIRDAVQGVGAPQKWLKSVDDAQQGRAQLQQQQAQAAEAEAAA